MIGVGMADTEDQPLPVDKRSRLLELGRFEAVTVPWVSLGLICTLDRPLLLLAKKEVD